MLIPLPTLSNFSSPNPSSLNPHLHVFQKFEVQPSLHAQDLPLYLSYSFPSPLFQKVLLLSFVQWELRKYINVFHTGHNGKTEGLTTWCSLFSKMFWGENNKKTRTNCKNGQYNWDKLRSSFFSLNLTDTASFGGSKLAERIRREPS